MGGSFLKDFLKKCGVFYPKSGVFLGFWVVFWVGVFGLWGGVLGPWCSGHTGRSEWWRRFEGAMMPRKAQEKSWKYYLCPRMQTIFNVNQSLSLTGKKSLFTYWSQSRWFAFSKVSFQSKNWVGGWTPWGSWGSDPPRFCNFLSFKRLI